MKADERLPHDLGDPCGLQHQTVQVCKHRRLSVRLKIDLVSPRRSLHEIGPRECVELALHRTRRLTAPANDLTNVECFVGVSEQEAEHTAPGLAEQHVSRL